MMPKPGAAQERLGLNLYDLEAIHPDLYKRTLSGVLDLRREAVIRVGSGTVDTAVPFSCALLLAATLCDILRSENRKFREPPIRVYLSSSQGVWTKLGKDAVLTTVGDRDGVRVVELDPRVFRSLAHASPDVPLLPKSLV